VKILRQIVEQATEAGLEFLLAGGHAVIAHGYLRNTFDVDLIVQRSRREHWADLVKRLGYVPFRDGGTFLQFNARDEDGMPLDLMLVSDETFSKLQAEAPLAPISAGGAKMVSLQHLLALKCHAVKNGHKGRIIKDADDVIRLIQANRLNVNEGSIKELLLKHGTPEFYEKVQRACGSD
jgi:predicted nucleotidyltransferase